MNPKIKKVDASIQEMEARLAETQAALKDLGQKRKMLEDLEIVEGNPFHEKTRYGCHGAD